MESTEPGGIPRSVRGRGRVLKGTNLILNVFNFNFNVTMARMPPSKNKIFSARDRLRERTKRRRISAASLSAKNTLMATCIIKPAVVKTKTFFRGISGFKRREK